MLRFLILTFASCALLKAAHAEQPYTVASHLASPFLELNPDRLLENELNYSSSTPVYRGFVMDLLKAMSWKLNFTYGMVTFEFYGKCDKQWHGMKRLLLNGNADMIVADFMETEERAQEADFTSPFLVTGLGIMYYPVSRESLPFTNIEELADQIDIQYGVVADGSTHELFKNSRNEIFLKMAQYFDEHPEVLESSAVKGVERVMNSNGTYAFIAEATVYHYLKKQKYPELVLVGETFLPHHYGIIFPKGASDRDVFDKVILEMNANGKLDALASKWSLK